MTEDRVVDVSGGTFEPRWHKFNGEVQFTNRDISTVTSVYFEDENVGNFQYAFFVDGQAPRDVQLDQVIVDSDYFFDTEEPILELGVGGGRATAQMSNAFNATIIGIDIDTRDEFLKEKQKHQDENNAVSFSVANWRELPFSDSTFLRLLSSLGWRVWLQNSVLTAIKK